MKKRITYILIFAFLINSILYFISFPFLIRSLKERFSEGSWKTVKKVNKVIEIFNGDYSKIQFIEDDEFYYEGNLYDVIEKKNEGDKVLFYCYHDKEEEKAKEDYNNNLNRKKRENINPINVSFYCAVINDFTYAFPPCKKIVSHIHINQMYTSIIQEIPFPPPRFLC